MIKFRLPAHNSREEAIAMKKIWFLLLLTLLSAALLTGCVSSADTLPSPTPGATNMLNNLMPDQNAATVSPTMDGMSTMMPGATAGTSANGEKTLETTQKDAQAMSEAVEKLSEVDDAYVVTIGDTALVGLKYEGQYQGGADDRLKKMVLTRIQTVDKTITKAAVTDNQALTASIEALAETLKGASSLTDVNTKAEELLKQMTVYSE